MTTVVEETTLRDRAISAWHEERENTRQKTITAARLVAGRFGVHLDDPTWEKNETPVWDITEVGVEATWIEYEKRDKTKDRAFYVLDRCAQCNRPAPVIRFTSLAGLGEAIERIANDDIGEWECPDCKKNEDAKA